MTQDLEKLSSLLDGECEDAQHAELAASNAVLRQKWKSYHLTRDIMRNDMSSDVSFDISDKVAAALRDELPILAPKRRFVDIPLVAAVVPVFRQSGQVAMAACVTAMVIFGYQTYYQPEVSQPFTTAPPVLGPQGGMAPVSLQQTRAVEQNMQQLMEQRRHINALIEDHQRQLKFKPTPVNANSAEDEITETSQKQP